MHNQDPFVAVSPIKEVSSTVRLPFIQVDTSNLAGASPRVDVVEVVKGVSPLEGTLTLSYRGSFTKDLAFDASQDEVSESLHGYH